MSTLSEPQKTRENSTTDKTPISTILRVTETPKDPLLLTPLQGYNTFDISGILLDDDDSQSQLNYILDKHPTQSFFSMYSMLRVQRITEQKSEQSQQKSFSSISRIYIYSCCGELYRKCCFTSIGMKCTLFINILLVLLNLYLIIYEAVLLSQSDAYQNTQLPIVFFVCDIFITMVLVIEVVLHWFMGYSCSCSHYLCHSTMDNKIDAVVMTLSVLCCILYVTDFENSSTVDNLLFLTIRITRDVIRIIRCYFFFKLLHENLAFGLDQVNVAAFHVQVPQNEGKSIQSNRWWDRYVQQRASLSTMCKMNSTTCTATAVIHEHKPYNEKDKTHDFLSYKNSGN